MRSPGIWPPGSWQGRRLLDPPAHERGGKWAGERGRGAAGKVLMNIARVPELLLAPRIPRRGAQAYNGRRDGPLGGLGLWLFAEIIE
jgi:hypothetical protein